MSESMGPIEVQAQALEARAERLRTVPEDDHRDGSVVLDRDGRAWQKEKGGWYRVITDVDWFSFGPNTPTREWWVDLYLDRGPLNVIWGEYQP